MKASRDAIDLRGKTAEEVAEIVRQSGFGDPTISDVTDLYKHYGEGITVTCVWLDGKAKGARFILWDGRLRKRQAEKDLHLFVTAPNDDYPQGKAEWGMINTLNLMR